MSRENTKLIHRGIFYKIKNYFYNLFNKNNKIKLIANQTEKHNKYKEDIVIKKDVEKERLIKIQSKIRTGEMNAENLSEEDLRKLKYLYDEQILELKEKIKNNKNATEKYKKEILEMKKQKKHNIE